MLCKKFPSAKNPHANRFGCFSFSIIQLSDSELSDTNCLTFIVFLFDGNTGRYATSLYIKIYRSRPTRTPQKYKKYKMASLHLSWKTILKLRFILQSNSTLRSNPYQPVRSLTLSSNPYQPMRLSTLRSNPDQLMSSSTLSSNPDQPVSSSTLSSNPYQPVRPSTLRSNPDQSVRSSTLRSNPDQSFGSSTQK